MMLDLTRRILLASAPLILAGLAASRVSAQEADLLPSWADTPARDRILGFVTATTTEGSPDFVPEQDRIAVFDNDGTLWSEQPLYFQFLFALDRAKALAAADPGWAATPVLQAAAAGDIKAVLAGGEAALVEVVSATHSGLTVEAFTEEVSAWIATARNPVTKLRYTDMVYQPMLELLTFLRARGYRTWIVSGGGADFMRAFAERVYGIPPEQVIGSVGKASFAIVDGVPQVLKDPGIAFIDDKGGKPVAIQRQIGRRPVIVGGNSDGDLAMLQWSTAGDGPRLGLIVHHTDGEREFAYDRPSAIGQLDKALDLAGQNGWVVVDIARDWRAVWPTATAD